MLLSARGILANRFGNVKDFFAPAGKTGENPVFMPPETAGKPTEAARRNPGCFRRTVLFYGFGTQTLQLAAMPPHSAMTSAQPGPTAVTRPVSSTVMMLSSELRHSSFAVVTASTG